MSCRQILLDASTKNAKGKKPIKIWILAKSHWRIYAIILLVFAILIFFYPGVNQSISRALRQNEQVTASFVFDGIRYARDFAVDTFNILSDNRDIRDYESFTEFAARMFRSQANRYQFENNTEMELRALSVSLLFNSDPYLLLRRHLLHISLGNHDEALKDFETLIEIFEYDDELRYLLESLRE